MPDAPKRNAGSKNAGKYAIYAVGGLGIAYVAYKLYENYVANAANTSTAGTPSSTTVPDTSSTTGSSGPTSTAGPAPITSIDQWKQAIIIAMVAAGIPGGENIAATAVTDALSGHALGPNEYSYLNAALASVGQPPGGAAIVLAAAHPQPKPTTTHTPSERPPAPVAKKPVVKSPVAKKPAASVASTVAKLRAKSLPIRPKPAPVTTRT